MAKWLLVAAAGFLAVAGCSNESGGVEADVGQSAKTALAPVECLTRSECVNSLRPPACQTARCEQGVCVTEAEPAGSPCDDAGTPPGACETPQCDGAGACIIRAQADGAPCGTVDACTKMLCSQGACMASEPLACWDGNPCTDDVCDPAVGCTFTDNSAPCDDQNACTEGDACAEGACVAGANVCECFGDPDCEGKDDNLCDGTLVCQDHKCVNNGAVVTCDVAADLGPCQTWSCVPETGLCAASPDPGAPCDDGDPCTAGDFCNDAGQCQKGNQPGCPE